MINEISKSNRHFSSDTANEIVRLIKQKLVADASTQKKLRYRIRKLGFHASAHNFYGGYTVADFLSVAIIDGNVPAKEPIKPREPQPKALKHKAERVTQKDEEYVVDLCDSILNCKALRQKRFDFLRGDAGHKLPVDAYYPELNLVIEYLERQHTESVPLFDKRITVSGISRGEQRKLYDDRRRKILPQYNLKLLEISYSDFGHDTRKKILRSPEQDKEMLKTKLKKFM